MTDAPELNELEALYSSLTPDERDELLQRLLIAVAGGWSAVTSMLEQRLLCQATGELLGEWSEG